LANSLAQELSVLLAPKNGLIIVAAASSALLGGAFLFEYVGGLAPCNLCIWQRWAHVAIIACAGLGLFAGRVSSYLSMWTGLVLCFGAALASAGIAGYHAGVEWQLWAGPSGCTSTLASNMSTSALVDQLLATPVVRCDDVPWSLFGLSMAGWNMLLSLDIAGVTLLSLVFGNRFARP
jgi:disulfide bond formation protein DsbB